MQILQRRQLSSVSIWFYLVGIFITSVWFMIIWEYRKIGDVQTIIESHPQTQTDSQQSPPLLSQTARDDTEVSETVPQLSQVEKDGLLTENDDSVVLQSNTHITDSQDWEQVPALAQSGFDVTEKTDETGVVDAKIYGLGDSIRECGQGEFFAPKDYLDSQCYVAEPEGYELPYNRTVRLWHVPRKNLGELNTSEHDYYNQVHNQRWLKMGKTSAHLQENGGTSMRAFGTNFDYFDILVNTTQIFSRCRNASKPVILDTGAGVASLAATAIDERAGNRSISIISYVPVDNYLRLGSIISDRGLPVFLHWFTGAKIPVPTESFDIVHCRWCWHHVVGYDTWLNEMNRIIIPGGAFVFTFVPVEDQELLPLEPWYEALAKMPWDCERYARIVQVCIKRNPTQEALPCSYKQEIENGVSSEDTFKQIKLAQEVLSSPDITWHPEIYDRILNMNCQMYQTCALLEETWNKPTTINTFNKTESGGDELRRLLQGGSVGLLHDWNNPGPFYPRFFDIINLMCGGDNEISRNVIFESHRLLRPDGFLIILDSACESFVDVVELMQEQLFHVVSNAGGVLVARKLGITNSVLYTSEK